MANTKTKKVNADVPQATGARLIISLKVPESKTAGGIIIPELSIKQENCGYIVNVSPDVTDERLVPGVLVYYGNYGGLEVTHKGKEYIILKQNDVACILPE